MALLIDKVISRNQKRQRSDARQKAKYASRIIERLCVKYQIRIKRLASTGRGTPSSCKLCVATSDLKGRQEDKRVT